MHARTITLTLTDAWHPPKHPLTPVCTFRSTGHCALRGCIGQGQMTLVLAANVWWHSVCQEDIKESTGWMPNTRWEMQRHRQAEWRVVEHWLQTRTTSSAFGLKESESIVNRGDRIDIWIPTNVNMKNVGKIRVMLKILIWRERDHLKKHGFTFDSSGLVYRSLWEWRENIMALLMSDNVEGVLCGQTGAGGWAGGLDGWMKLV